MQTLNGEPLEGADPSELYAKWKKIYPKYQPGFFRNLRWGLSGFFLALFVLVPYLRWQRLPGMPDQAVLFDLPGRKFHIFDLVVWPQDIFMLAFLLIAMAIGLFFMTALAGRVFCGYLCFQTVWTDLFLWVEKLTEGNRKQRITLDQGANTPKKLARKLLKHSIWLGISLLTGASFVFYFGDVHVLTSQFLAGTAPEPAWVTLLFITISTYTMAGFAREQVCIYMCPYARFQGAMFDEETIIIAYDEKRGEPRERNRRYRTAAGAAIGDCIDCRECVVVCPTGIDIRDGQQYQCITCGACIDACNAVMRKTSRPPGLVRYTSLHALQGGTTRFLRPRVLIYGGLLILFLGAIVGYFGWHSVVELNVVAHRSPPYIRLSSGAIQNNYTVRVINMSHQDHEYTLEVAGLPGSELAVAALANRDARGRPRLTVKSGGVEPFTVYVRQPRDSLVSGRTDLDFVLTATDSTGGSAVYHSNFLRP